MAFMFPTVMLVLNVSSVAAIWFGADRIDSGADADRRADRVPQLPDPDPHVGDDGDVRRDHGPARRPSARSGSRRCSTPRPRSCRPPKPVTELRRAARSNCATSGSRYPGAEAPVLCDISLPARGRGRPRPSSAAPARARRRCSTCPAAVRRDRRCGARRRRRRARDRTRAAVEPHRTGAAEAVPVLRHGREQPALRQPRRDRRRSCGRRSRSPRPATSSRRCPAASTRRSRRAAPTCRAGSASAWPSPGRWCASPGIYLFDDSFSALDLATDARLRAALVPATPATRRS